MSKLDHAVAASRIGPVFPLLPDSKKPAVKWKAWATRDESRIREHWAANPEHNIGLVTTDLLVLDVDTSHKDKKTGEVINGEVSLEQLEISNGDLPPTLEQKTASGGRHVIFTAPKPV